MPVETSAVYISDLNTSWPLGYSDQVSDLDDSIQVIKSTLQNTFPYITGAMTATHTELNLLAGALVSTAEINYLQGATNGTVLTTGDEGAGGGIDADTVDGNEATALLARANHTGTQVMSTISDAGNLATRNTVNGSYIDINSITNSHMADNSVDTAEIVAAAINESKINWSFDATASWSIASSGSQLIPVGLFMVVVTGSGTAALRFDATGAYTATLTSGLIMSDGSTVHIHETGGGSGITVYYKQLA